MGVSASLMNSCVAGFNDVCAGRRRPARRTATLSIYKLVWANTSSDRCGHITRSAFRRRLACLARACASFSGVMRGNGIAVVLVVRVAVSFFVIGGERPRHSFAATFATGACAC